jgi:beta-phosphoglucomutase-like phosphatase (HAD superfamily)
MKNTCVIFDVDGTLIDSTAFDDKLYGLALADVLGAFVPREVTTSMKRIQGFSGKSVERMAWALAHLSPKSSSGRRRH